MKSLKESSHAERAQLLFELFPEEMPGVVDFISGMCAAIKEDEQRNREAWDNPHYDFDFWLDIIGQVSRILEIFGSQLNENSELFSEKLFAFYNALFTAHCLRLYATTRQHANTKFRDVIHILFG